MPVINVATFIYIADGNFAMVPPASVKEVTGKTLLQHLTPLAGKYFRIISRSCNIFSPCSKYAGDITVIRVVLVVANYKSVNQQVPHTYSVRQDIQAFKQLTTSTVISRRC